MKANSFVSACLRGAGQVFFMESALAGFLFIVAIAYASYDTGQWATTVGAVLGLVVATLTAGWSNCDKTATQSGLYGFNGILTGLALATFLAPSASLWFYIVLGAVISVMATAAFAATLTRSWGIPGSTGPFVLTAWLMLIGAHVLGAPNAVTTSAIPGFAETDYLRGFSLAPVMAELRLIFFRNIAQVFLLGSAASGAIILLGILFASWRAAVAATAGSVLAMACAFALRTDPAMVVQGLYGFSPVLTAMAVGVVFLRPSIQVAAYAALATGLTVCVQVGLNALLAPTSLPFLTAPYVLVMYLFVAGKAGFFLVLDGTASRHG